jgi:hypothetical protein
VYSQQNQRRKPIKCHGFEYLNAIPLEVPENMNTLRFAYKAKKIEHDLILQ